MSFANNKNQHSAAVFVAMDCMCDSCCEGRTDYGSREYYGPRNFDDVWNLMNDDDIYECFELCLAAYNLAGQQGDCFTRFDIDMISSDFQSSCDYIKSFLTMEYGKDAHSLLSQLIFFHIRCPFDDSKKFQGRDTLIASTVLPLGASYIFEHLSGLIVPTDLVEAVSNRNLANFKDYLNSFHMNKEEKSSPLDNCGVYLRRNCGYPLLSRDCEEDELSDIDCGDEFCNLLLEADTVPMDLFYHYKQMLDEHPGSYDGLCRLYDHDLNKNSKLSYYGYDYSQIVSGSWKVEKIEYPEPYLTTPVAPPSKEIESLLYNYTLPMSIYDIQDPFYLAYSYAVRYDFREDVPSHFNYLPTYIKDGLVAFDDLICIFSSSLTRPSNVVLAIKHPLGLERLIAKFVESYDVSLDLYVPDTFEVFVEGFDINVYSYSTFAAPPLNGSTIYLDPDDILDPDIASCLKITDSGRSYVLDDDMMFFPRGVEYYSFIGFNFINFYVLCHYLLCSPSSVFPEALVQALFDLFSTYYKFSKGLYVSRIDVHGCLLCMGILLSAGHISCSYCNRDYYQDPVIEHKERKTFLSSERCVTLWSYRGVVNQEAPLHTWTAYGDYTSDSPPAYTLRDF